MEGAAYESEELSLYSLRSLDASVLLGALTSALLPSEDIFCHTQAAAELSLVTRGQGTGPPSPEGRVCDRSSPPCPRL